MDMATPHCITSTLEMCLVSHSYDTVALISLHVLFGQTYLQLATYMRTKKAPEDLPVLIYGPIVLVVKLSS